MRAALDSNPSRSLGLRAQTRVQGLIRVVGRRSEKRGDSEKRLIYHSPQPLNGDLISIGPIGSAH